VRSFALPAKPVEYSEAAHEQTAALREYGVHLGRAFQITDDLLDVSGDPAHTGKAASDAANNKTTAPAIFGWNSPANLHMKRANRPLVHCKYSEMRRRLCVNWHAL
jgi:geranylgeranyl pyrophosphate synthase